MPSPCPAIQPRIKGRDSTGISTPCGKAAPFLSQGHSWLSRWGSFIAVPQHGDPWVLICKPPARHSTLTEVWDMLKKEEKVDLSFHKASTISSLHSRLQPWTGKDTSKFSFLHQSVTTCISARPNTTQARLHCAHCSGTAAFLLPQIQRSRIKICSFLSFSHLPAQPALYQGPMGGIKLFLYMLQPPGACSGLHPGAWESPDYPDLPHRQHSTGKGLLGHRLSKS